MNLAKPRASRYKEDEMIIRLAEESEFEMGGLFVRPSSCEIVRSGDPVRVEPRVMQVLVALSRRKGETVSHDTLHEECWGETAVGDDAIVRSVSQLRKALGNGDGTVTVETVPKVGYRLVVPKRRNAPAIPVAAVAAGIATVFALALDRTPPPPDTSLLSTPLTSLPGLEQWPAISPSGGQVAYTWERDLYVRSVGDDAHMRLTHSEDHDEYHPVWSPDGGRVAFVQRGPNGNCTIHAVSPFGGSSTQLARCGTSDVLALDWSPDGDTILYTARDGGALVPGRAHLVDLSSGAQSEVLTPDEATASVEEVSFSADGTKIAFTSSLALGVEDIYVHDLENGTRTRVTHDGLKIHGFDWLPDGRGFVVSSNRGGEFALWRVTADGENWHPIPGAVGGADEPDASQTGRIVYEVWRSRAGIWRATQDDPTPLVTSTRFDWDAERSPDGKRITFISDRSGSAEVWVANADGEDAKRLTRFGGAYTHTPRFSPDGLEIAFATPASGNFDLYVVDVDSGELERLTTDPAEDFAPAWSLDGRSLFFGSTRSGEWQIWRLDLESKATVQVTQNGGRVAQRSPDGRSLYFIKADRPGLYRLPDEERVVEELTPVDWNNWQVLDEAIYYVRRPEPNHPELARFDLSTGEVERLAPLPDLLYKSGLWVSPDASEILFTRVSDVEADLMLIDAGGT